jgi:hypothetical protein
MYAPRSRLVEPTYAILRIVAGLLFASHGPQKLFGIFNGTARPPASLMGLAGIRSDCQSIAFSMTASAGAPATGSGYTPSAGDSRRQRARRQVHRCRRRRHERFAHTDHERIVLCGRFARRRLSMAAFA